MKLIIDDNLLDKASLTIEELLYLILMDLETTNDIVESLESKGWLREGHLTEENKGRLADILNETKEEPSTDTRIERLAEELMKIFPQGRKEGTPYYWKGNRQEIKNKLKKFFVYFGDKYDDRQILSAARDYVNSFNGDYHYMRLLKYFIWKSDRSKVSSDTPVELVSDLATCIENAGQEESFNRDWATTLR